MELRTLFALNLKRLRVGAGLSQEALADIAGLDRTYISALERCRYSATLDVMERLSAALQTDACELIRKE